MMVERSMDDALAQESLGQRVILRRPCDHRLPCGDATDDGGRRVHIDGLTFLTEDAASRFDRTQLLPAPGSWQTFRSWDAARAWLHGAP